MTGRRYDYEKEKERRRKLRKRLEKNRRRRNSAQKMLIEGLKIAGVVAAAAAVVILTVILIQKKPWENGMQTTENAAVTTETGNTEINTEDIIEITEPETIKVGDAEFKPGYEAVETPQTITIPNMNEKDQDKEGYIDSGHIILINENTGEIVAQKGSKEIINPASMTKVLTVLVAAEHLKPEDYDQKVKITLDITDFVYQNDCSAVNFSLNEKVPVRDLFYGTILPSGADAAIALTNYVAGSQEAFVQMMNDKLAELGLSETAHFTNCVGLYDKNHYCTVYDMAVIMKAALENDFCRDVLSKHTYTTTKTKKHKKGITISNWFLRRIEDHPCGGTVLCAKTGFVTESLNCAVSYELSSGGTPYVLVTAKAHGGWRCIFDHVAIYKAYAK